MLHVRTVSGNGCGPEKTLLEGAGHLTRLGVHCEALYLLDSHTPSDMLLSRAERSEMPVHVVSERSAVDPAGAGALARLVRNGRFNIVHTHDYKSNALARLLTAAGSYRIVATAHGYNQTTRREGYYYALERLLLRRADAVICPSAALADYLIDTGVSRTRVHVIANGIALDDWPFSHRQRRGTVLNVLYAGRLSPEKNVASLLQACHTLTSQGRSVRLSLAGEGPDRQALGELTDELKLTDQVQWLGLRNDVANLLGQADVFVNPSSTEGMPNSVLEALACGTPVTATDVGATNELILHEKTGLLIPPNEPSAIADAIARIDDHPAIAQHMARAGRTHVQRNFTLTTRAAHVVALYRGVLAAARRHL